MYLIVCVATLGNTLGSIFTFFIGSIGKQKWLNYFGFNTQKLEHFKIQFKKYGVSLSLLSWVPVIGDVIVLFLGYFKTRKSITFLFIFFGKLARYALVAYLL